VSVYPGRVARHVIITWYAGCVVGESYPIHACVRAEDILHESAECANRIRPSALHVIILPTVLLAIPSMLYKISLIFIFTSRHIDQNAQ
jgi:hypothetical protein